jgi:hypothetical protein
MGMCIRVSGRTIWLMAKGLFWIPTMLDTLESGLMTNSMDQVKRAGTMERQNTLGIFTKVGKMVKAGLNGKMAVSMKVIL